LSYRFKDLKSSNQQLLTSDRNLRLINTLSPNKTILNFSEKGNNLNSLIYQNVSNTLGSDIANVYNSSNAGWADTNNVYKLLNNNTVFTASHTPLLNKTSSTYPLGYDKYAKGEDDLTPQILRSKEEAAPNYVFNSY